MIDRMLWMKNSKMGVSTYICEVSTQLSPSLKLISFVKLDKTWSMYRWPSEVPISEVFPPSRTSERKTSDRCRLLSMTFSVREKAEIFSKYYAMQSITVTQQWFCLTLYKSSLERSAIFISERSFYESRNLAHRGENDGPGTIEV